MSEPFIAREAGSGTRALFEEALSRVNIVPRVVLVLPTLEGIVQAVDAGVGLAVVSSLATITAIREGRLVRIDIPGLDFTRRFKLVRLKHLTPSPAGLEFANLVLQIRTEAKRATGRKS